MKSFIGAVKVIARIIQHCSALIAPLDDAIVVSSQDGITWIDELHNAFTIAYRALSYSHSITLP